MGHDLFASPAVCGTNGSMSLGHSTGGSEINPSLACYTLAGDLPAQGDLLAHRPSEYFGCNLSSLTSWKGMDFSLAKFLGDGRWKSLHCRNKRGKRQFCVFLVKWRGKWGWQGTGMNITVGSQCVRKMTHPSPPADSFLATGLGITLKWTVKYKVPHLTVWHIIFPWHLITYPFLQLFVLSQMSRVNAWINEDGSHHFHDMLQNIHRWCFKACHLPQ